MTYRIDGGFDSTDGTESFFESAHDVRQVLNLGSSFDFNRGSPGKVTHSNPQEWGTCPAVDA